MENVKEMVAVLSIAKMIHHNSDMKEVRQALYEFNAEEPTDDEVRDVWCCLNNVNTDK
jgi:hypothetical protein